MDERDAYLAQLQRVYGLDCVKESVVEEYEDGYLVAIHPYPELDFCATAVRSW